MHVSVCNISCTSFRYSHCQHHHKMSICSVLEQQSPCLEQFQCTWNGLYPHVSRVRIQQTNLCLGPLLHVYDSDPHLYPLHNSLILHQPITWLDLQFHANQHPICWNMVPGPVCILYCYMDSVLLGSCGQGKTGSALEAVEEELVTCNSLWVFQLSILCHFFMYSSTS